jgi:hypothetical protein
MEARVRIMLPLALALACAAVPASAQAPAPNFAQQWSELVAAAQKEGRVVILAPPDTAVRQALPAAFKARYGITVDYLGGRSSESAGKMRSEREAGVYTVDVALAGIQTMATIFYREKMLVPLRPLLIDPDVIDPGKWKRGSLWFMDPEQQYILRLFNTAGANFYVNTQFAKPSDFHSARDLLDPKWKGKISMADPTVPGTGSNQAARFYVQFGEDYVKRLYVDQQPGIAAGSARWRCSTMRRIRTRRSCSPTGSPPRKGSKFTCAPATSRRPATTSTRRASCSRRSFRARASIISTRSTGSSRSAPRKRCGCA